MRHGSPIQSLKLRFKLDTGIDIKELPGIIPTFYEMKACVAANYQFFDNWQELAEWQKAKLIALYFADNLVNGAKDDTVQEKIELDNKKRSKK
jgi:hypothetical protein